MIMMMMIITIIMVIIIIINIIITIIVYMMQNPLKGNSLLVYPFPAFYGIRGFITVYTKARN
jgi:hypothetical protein